LSVLDCSKLTEDCRNYVFDVVEYSELRERGRRTLIWSSFERDGEKVVFVALVQSDVHLFVFQVKHRRVAEHKAADVSVNSIRHEINIGSNSRLVNKIAWIKLDPPAIPLELDGWDVSKRAN
jgi:hypothetical protein